MAFNINRRTALTGAAALAALPAMAQEKKVIIGTWGGDYSRLLTKNIDSLMMGNKLGIINSQYQYTMMAASLASGGKMGDFDPGKERLVACKKAGARIYPSNEAFAQALKTEEIACGIMWKARAVQWQNAGINVQTVAPIEGVPMYVSGFVVPKNAPNKAGAYAYLDAMMEPSAQEGFAVDMGYNPTVTNAKVAPDVQKRIGFTEEEQKRLRDLDYAYMAQNDAAFQEWWNKSFKA